MTTVLMSTTKYTFSLQLCAFCKVVLHGWHENLNWSVILMVNDLRLDKLHQEYLRKEEFLSFVMEVSHLFSELSRCLTNSFTKHNSISKILKPHQLICPLPLMPNAHTLQYLWWSLKSQIKLVKLFLIFSTPHDL